MKTTKETVIKEHATESPKRSTSIRLSGSDTKIVIMSVALVVLLVVSGIQTIALVNLNGKMKETIEKLPSTGRIATTGGGPSALSENLKNLPSMVGGC